MKKFNIIRQYKSTIKKSQCDNSVRQSGSYQRECVQITNIEKDIAEVECLYFEGRTENNTANMKNYLETA